ncbi:MAG: metallophosphoesterase [Candidatus Lambdaproteobacteria bacterium]|nr:metallophosphoesterase [Candidatus Lambdaproteobacteria bacterium]
MDKPFVLIHISDLHIHRLPHFPGGWRGKRTLGALNLLLNRRRRYPRARAAGLVRWLDAQEWDHLLISGDLTQLGTRVELAEARALLAPLLARGSGRVTVLPGNHDRYVPDAAGDGFRETFGEFFGPGEIVTKPLAGPWWLCGWDSAGPRAWRSAEGHVRDETLRATEAWLATLPRDAQVLLANHYPLYFPPDYTPKRRHELDNLAVVRTWVRANPPRAYLHGHDHRNWNFSPADLGAKVPMVNSASSTQVPGRGQTALLHRISLLDKDMLIEGLHPRL